jgi:hypothetical protein
MKHLMYCTMKTRGTMKWWKNVVEGINHLINSTMNSRPSTCI